MAKPILSSVVSVNTSAPRSLELFKQALCRGYSIDAARGKAYRPDGSEWVARINSRGYPSLQAKINGQQLHIPLHKAVAFVLWGDGAFGGPGVHVRHLDSDKLNSRGDNLAIGTAQDNALDKPAPQRSDASRKRAITIGKSRLSEIGAKSNATRGRDAAIRYGRIGGAATKKLTPEQVVVVRRNANLSRSERITQRKLAEALGVKQGTISDILAGRCYGDVGIESA